MPTRISEMPITRMMVPVTTGGNSGSIRLTKGASRRPKTPAAMTEPKIPSEPDLRSCRAIASIGADRGESDAHHHRQPDADAGKAERLIRVGDAAGEQVGGDQEGDSCGGRLSARPMISGTATAPAYITSTCCRPRVKRRGYGRTSSTGCTDSDMQPPEPGRTGDQRGLQKAVSSRNVPVREFRNGGPLAH